MVHARPFSFTDDATSVQLPVLPATVPPVGIETPLLGPHSMHTALLFFQLRRAQSNWYQELFQTSSIEYPVSSPYLWQICYDMRAWSETFPKALPAAMKGVFDLELLYSYIYCLAPSCRVPAVSELGKTLIYEYSMQYMDMMYSISKDPINTGFYTYHDTLRVYFIGSQYLAVLRGSADSLLAGIPPAYVSQTQGGPPPPPIPNVGRHDNLERSIKCIEQVLDILETFGERWSDSQALKGGFKMQADPALEDLRKRQDAKNSRPSLPRTTSEGHSSPGSVINNYAQQLGQTQYSSSSDWLSMGHMIIPSAPVSALPQGQLLQPGIIGYQNQGLMGPGSQGSSPQALSGYSQGSSPQMSYGQGSSPQYYPTQAGESPQGQQLAYQQSNPQDQQQGYHQSSPQYQGQQGGQYQAYL